MRCRARGTAHIEALLAQLPAPGGLLAAESFARLDDLRAGLPPPVDWAAVPLPARPEAVLGEDSVSGPAPAGATPAAHAARIARKRAQVESFAAVMRLLLDATPTAPDGGAWHVVDFGCGSGGLLLPLAACFPACSFVGVDMLAKSIHLLRARADAAGLANVTGVVGMIERYQARAWTDYDTDIVVVGACVC